MPQESFQFKPADYERALALGPTEGFACHTLAELFAFVTGLLRWKGLATGLRLPDSAKGVLTGPGAWWFRGVDSDRHPLHSGIYRRDVKKLRYSRPVTDANDLDRRLRHEYFQQTRRQFHDLTNFN